MFRFIRPLLVIVAAGLCLAWADNWQGIRAAAGRLQSVSADFLQEKHMKILARPIRSKGRFYFQKPGAIRWEYHAPVRSVLLVSDGSTRQFVQGDTGMEENTGPQLQSMDIVMQEIGSWMNGRFDESQAFEATLAAARTIRLTPRHAAFARFIQKIEITLARQDGVIDAVTIYESGDSFTRLTFVNTVANKALPAKLFTEL